MSKNSLRSRNICLLLSLDNQDSLVVMYMFNFNINSENLLISMLSRDYIFNFKRKLRISNISSNVSVSGF